MRKASFVLVFCVVVIFVLGCASTPKDYGVYNPTNVSDEDLCTLFIHQNISVDKFDDDDKIRWLFSYSKKTVKVPSGVHTFRVKYSDGQRQSIASSSVVAQLEKGNTYLLKGTIEDQKIFYKVVLYNDQQESEDVTLVNTLPTFIKYVLNPTMDSTKKTVKLENDNIILILEPDMVYKTTDKVTRKSTEGRWGFSMHFTMTNPKVFLLETDIKQMSSKQFLDSSNYQEKSQTILIPVKCSEKEVIFRYERPAELQGKEVTFSISVGE